MPPKQETTVPKNKAKAKAKIPSTEKYDWSRTQGIDPRDARATGPPCFGEHTPEPAGRGSRSGSNKWGTWTSCEGCGVRLTYTPAWGAHGMTRQAGPLPKDVKDQLVEKSPPKGDLNLNNHKIALDAQQRSLENQLKNVKEQKEAWAKFQAEKDKHKGYLKEPKELQEDKWVAAENQFLESSVPAAQGSGSTLSDLTSNRFCPKMTPEELANYHKQQEEEMRATPGRKTRKANETPEDLEYNQRSPEQSEWSVVTAPQPNQ